MSSGTVGRSAVLKLFFLWPFLWVSLPAYGYTPSCTLSFTNLAFGTYSGTALTTTVTATVNCPRGNSYSIPLDAGTGSGATETTRQMTGSSGTLAYQIFLNASHTNNWGNTSGSEASGTGSGSNQTYTGYGLILDNQYATPGTYTDTVSSSTQSFSVTATIQSACTLSAASLAFGTYTGASVTASTNVSVQCTNTTPYSITLNAGTTPGATTSNRLLAGPSGQTLAYSLSWEAGFGSRGGRTSNTFSGTGTGSVQSVPLYGQVAAGQYVTPGSYTDTITASITY